MTKEEIIEMANQAKLPHDYVGGELMWLDKLEQFAQLIVEKEREECAKVCEKEADDGSDGEWDTVCHFLAKKIRGQE